MRMRERELGKKAEVRGAKAMLRKQVDSALARVPMSARVAGSAQACARLETQRAWREATAILFFAPLSTELDIWPLLARAIAAGKIASLPRFERATGQYSAARVEDPVADVHAGRFGIREPVSRCPSVPLNRLDFILVPGVAFDLQGRRLGRGKGFYDRLLATVRGTTCGVAFDEQIVRKVPVEPHDVYLNCILTPTRWIEL
jgi:5-formyltetrahydrofolate cyclo-ligase